MKQAAPASGFAVWASGNLAQRGPESAEARAFQMSYRPLGPAHTYLKLRIEALSGRSSDGTASVRR